MRIPDYVRIGGVEYRVEVVDEYILSDDGRRYEGEINYRQHVITLSSKGVSAQELQSTLLHEVLHGVLAHMCLSELKGDEDTVTALEKGLFMVIQDNPTLFMPAEADTDTVCADA